MLSGKGPSREPARFDAGFFRRFYLKPGTRVREASGQIRLARFVFAYMGYLGLPVRRVLDLGCGLGAWQRDVARSHPEARYQGVEASDYLCAKFGWKRGTVADYRDRGRFDLVICQSVLQYLSDGEVRRGVENMARLCRGALYLETVTRLDWEANCDRKATDGRIHLRDGAWYRRQLGRHFRSVGGGVFLPKDSPVVLYELEGH